jgi:ATP-dependent DNA ligase
MGTANKPKAAIRTAGFRVIARKNGKRVKLYSRPGNDLTYRFPLIVEAVAKLRSQSCIIDGEAISCGDDGIASFDRIRYRRHDADVQPGRRAKTIDCRRFRAHLPITLLGRAGGTRIAGILFA